MVISLLSEITKDIEKAEREGDAERVAKLLGIKQRYIEKMRHEAQKGVADE